MHFVTIVGFVLAALAALVGALGHGMYELSFRLIAFFMGLLGSLLIYKGGLMRTAADKKQAEAKAKEVEALKDEERLREVGEIKAAVAKQIETVTKKLDELKAHAPPAVVQEAEKIEDEMTLWAKNVLENKHKIKIGFERNRLEHAELVADLNVKWRNLYLHFLSEVQSRLKKVAAAGGDKIVVTELPIPEQLVDLPGEVSICLINPPNSEAWSIHLLPTWICDVNIPKLVVGRLTKETPPEFKHICKIIPTSDGNSALVQTDVHELMAVLNFLSDSDDPKKTFSEVARIVVEYQLSGL